MTLTILLVDDSEHDQLAHKRALRETGYTVISAQTIFSGLELVTEFQPDVILLDYNLPDGNGLDFISLLWEQESELAPPVVMLTGSGNESVAVAAIKAGVNDYLIKDVAGGHLKLLPMVVERAVRDHANRLAKREAEQQLQLAANVYHNITEGILATKPDGTIASANPAFCGMAGYSVKELIGANPRIMKSNRHDSHFYETLWSSIARDGCWQGEVWNRHKNGSLFLVRETITAIRDDHGRLQHYVAVMIDITDAKRAEDFVRHQAYHDALTDLPNRSLFMDRLRHQLSYAHRQKTWMAVMFIDLDGFKAINDELGHATGDELLRQVAQRLKGCVRESDTVARFGGDEFAAIINNISDTESVIQVASKMLEQLSQPFTLKDKNRQISASIGIALYPVDCEDGTGLLKAADEAMYQAKRDGKARFVFSSM
jgi:diguanylate cyclase (GGDEF)-like protein/PAS domain S-box-containing protein